MLRRAVVLAVLGVLAAEASAQSLVVGDETWTHQRTTTGDIFTRADGTRMTVEPATAMCDKLTRATPAARYDWIPRVYWPTVDLAAGALTLCLARTEGPVVVAILPPAGKVVRPDVAPALRRIAELGRAPTPTAAVGPIHPSLPVAMSTGEVLGFVTSDGHTLTLSLMHGDGSCAYDHSMVAVKMGKPTSAQTFADGYWKTVFHSNQDAIGCLDVRDGYVTVLMSPSSRRAALADVLGEVRRAAYARHGEPITNQTDPMVLPRTQQRVSAQQGAGLWKAVDGARYDTAGGDALVSIFPLGIGSTMYVIGVVEGPCAPGTTAAAPALAARLFPPQLGAVWVDDGQYKLRWKAWACVEHGGASATLTVMGPVASDQPPEQLESSAIKAMVGAVARSYGLAVDTGTSGAVTPGGGGGGGGRGYRRRTGVLLQGLGYFGIISFNPEGGDAARGGLVGLNTRIATTDGVGLAFAFDVEAGYGNGELIGEVRAGLGVATGRDVVLDLLAGASVGSTGPAAALDVYGEASVTFPMGTRGGLWFGAMHAIGVAGPDHDRLEARALFGGKREGAFFVGARYLRFADSLADDGVTMVGNGDAFLFTFGGGTLVRE